ncbi:MAG TPA: metallophosphoesterase [Longimicrobiaceae bacterium]|nr:metallophosphoesterase [Longimicrobiaceae bacterium]
MPFRRFQQPPRALLVALLLITGCRGMLEPGTRNETSILLAAGDIAGCSTLGDEATAALLDTLPGTIAALGDNAYESGTAEEYAQCYAPTWGRHRYRTRPTPGNHEYATPGAAPYYAYFGAAAGPVGLGWYSYELGSWHMVVLNSEVARDSSSAQLAWLRADLAASHARCTMAYWHRPRFSSSTHGPAADLAPLWQALYDGGAEVVLSGHDHTYERFAPQTALGAADTARGIRQFIAGTGGRGLYPFKTPQTNSEARFNAALGILRFELHPTGYRWKFIPVSGAVPDSGSAACH